MHQFIRGCRRIGAVGLAVFGLAATGGFTHAQQPAEQAPPPVAARPGMVDRGTGATLVPIGGSQTLRMKSKKLIKTALNEKDSVARIAPVVTDPAAVLITGLQAGTTRVTLTDVDDKTEVIDIVVQLDVDFLRTLLRRAVPTADIEVVPALNNVLILTGYVCKSEDIDIILRVAQSTVGGGPGNIINALTVGGVMQVQLDVTVAQVNRTEARNQGFNFLIGNSVIPFISQVGNLVTLQNITASGGLAGGMMQTGTLVGPNIATASPVGTANIAFGVVPSRFLGILQVLRQESLAKLLAEPKLITLSGRPASFVSGGSQAVPQVVGGVGGGSVGTNFVDFGTELTFLPIVLGTGKIYLEVEPSVSSLNNAFGFSFGGVTVPGRNVQRVRTAVLMEDGQTFAIGGLIQNVVNANDVKTPILGDIPFVAPFFQTINYQEQEQELVVLVTPHLVDPMDCHQQPRKLPGRETRAPDDFELFLEGLLETPRGQRKIFEGHQYIAAYKNDPASAALLPCARNGNGGLHGGSGGCDNCAGGAWATPGAPVLSAPGAVPPVMTAPVAAGKAMTAPGLDPSVVVPAPVVTPAPAGEMRPVVKDGVPVLPAAVPAPVVDVPASAGEVPAVPTAR
jgi:pilus assembly protein CpaC